MNMTRKLSTGKADRLIHIFSENVLLSIKYIRFYKRHGHFFLVAHILNIRIFVLIKIPEITIVQSPALATGNTL